jgi:KUP system potassium uptake protein
MTRKHDLSLTLAALGVVFGDIGTSPIYALRECFFGSGHVEPTPDNILGVLSLVFWALILIISIKYIVFVMRAHNHGEGGIAALTALLNPWGAERGSSRHVLLMMGLFGAALLYGDGTITPAISVMSAIEGIDVAAPAFHHFVIPITLAILIVLFAMQRRGTEDIGFMFGPVLLLWFVAIAALGVYGIVKNPTVLHALNPWQSVAFFIHNGAVGFTVLGAVFLAVTGGEALYADMGHFGREPIRRAWFFLVLPALVLNYFGQGARVMSAPDEAHEPFYHLAPQWALYPLIALATAATIIASQAIITGTFSMTSQLIRLGQLPRMKVVQTSSEERGQIYLPFVNWALMMATLALVLGFRSSSALASAYGIAVAMTMVITTILAYFVALRFHWSLYKATLTMLPFLAIDMIFFLANVSKIEDGGWYPITMAALVFLVMVTWARGRQLLALNWGGRARTPEELAAYIVREKPNRIPGTAVLLTPIDRVPPHFFRHLELHHVVQRHLLLVTVETHDVPRIATAERLQLYGIAPGITRLIVRYGFMQQPNVPVALRLCERFGLDIDLDQLTYYVGRETLIPTIEVKGMRLWREYLFAFLARNALRATAFYGLPPEDVVELGFQVEI